EARLSLGEFEAALDTSLEEWRRRQLKSAWLHVPLRLAPLMAAAAARGFEVHRGRGEVVVLKQWLRPDLEDKVPPGATHQVGVAGFVLSEGNELLLMKEAAPARRAAPAQWKLPGGLLEPGESFGEAACREVYEEVGIRCRFASVLAFWHRHGLPWGQSDLYVVCRLEPLTRELRPDPTEVAACCWMPVEEFLRTQSHPLITHVLRNVYGLRPGGSQPSSPLVPLAELAESAVQWPGRDPYPTYHAAVAAGAVAT
ncbi:unnamed protein product, partial [Prorocentrum cordatum]